MYVTTETFISDEFAVNMVKKMAELGELKNKHVIVKMEFFNEEFKAKLENKPEAYRVFYCEAGNGCFPDRLGTKIYGYFLSDGEHCYIRREFVEREATRLEIEGAYSLLRKACVHDKVEYEVKKTSVFTPRGRIYEVRGTCSTCGKLLYADITEKDLTEFVRNKGTIALHYTPEQIEKIFCDFFNGETNFMTPEPINYFSVDNYLLEVSKGVGMKNQEIYGLTVLEEVDTKEQDIRKRFKHIVELGRMFYDLSSLYRYVNSVFY